MKKKTKKIILCVAILLTPCIYKKLVYRNISKSPIGPRIRTPNGSHVNIRTIIHEPGK